MNFMEIDGIRQSQLALKVRLDNYVVVLSSMIYVYYGSSSVYTFNEELET